jgi:putative endonuclease
MVADRRASRSTSRDLRRKLGRRGEQLALDHFERLGFRLVARNYRTRRGEIDLIVSDGQTLAFVEVKTRCSGAGHPLDSIGVPKQRRVRRMAREWLLTARRSGAPELRFDAVGVTLDARGELVVLDHLEGAF